MILRRIDNIKVLNQLKSLLFLEGETGINLNLIYKLIGVEDLEYALYILVLLENDLIDTNMTINFDPESKIVKLQLREESIIDLQEKGIIPPSLSKAERATLACILLQVVENLPISIDEIKKIRKKKNINPELKVLEEKGYIKIQNSEIEITDFFKTHFDFNRFSKQFKKIMES